MIASVPNFGLSFLNFSRVCSKCQVIVTVSSDAFAAINWRCRAAEYREASQYRLLEELTYGGTSKKVSMPSEAGPNMSRAGLGEMA